MSTTAPETYEGWKNYPTWAVNLWLSNDEGLYEMTREAVRDEYADAENCINVRENIWTIDEARRFNTADRLREMVEELGVTVDSGHTYPVNGQPVGFSADLLDYALGQVDWHEIAAAWLEDVSAEVDC